MPYEQYAANMDLGHVYVGIMQHVHDTGFDYVDSELEKWQREIGHSLVIAAITTTTSPVDLTSNSFPNSGDLFAQFSRDDALASNSYQEKVVTADASDLTSHGVEFKDIYLFDSDIGALRELGESGFDFLIGRSSRLFPPDRDQESGTSELGRSNIFLNEAIEGLSDDHSPLKTMVLVDNGEGKVERLVLSHTRSNDDTSDFSIEMMEEELASALRRGVPIETISLPEGWNVHHVDTADVDKSYKTVPTIKDKVKLADIYLRQF